MVAEAGGAALSKLAGRAGEDVEAAATHEASTFCPLSFAPSTLVSTPKGKQSIASLKVGDKVLAYNPKTGKATMQTVEQTYLTQDTGLLDVTLRPVIQPASRHPGGQVVLVHNARDGPGLQAAAGGGGQPWQPCPTLLNDDHAARR